MRIHPISLALRYLKGQRTIEGAPFYGRPICSSRARAIDTLRRWTGEDFGDDASAWGAWLRKNRWVYTAKPSDPRFAKK